MEKSRDIAVEDIRRTRKTVRLLEALALEIETATAIARLDRALALRLARPSGYHIAI